MEEPEYLDECNKLWFLLSQTRAAVYKARLKKLGRFLHPNWAAALFVTMIFDKETTPVLLSRHLFLERHSVSELIMRMQSKGLIKKHKDIKKKNMVRISLTKKGRDVCYQAMQPDFITGLFSSLSCEQQKQLRSSLQTLFDKAIEELGITREQLIHIV